MQNTSIPTISDLTLGATYLINTKEGKYLEHVTVESILNETVFLKGGTARTFVCYDWFAVLASSDHNE